MFDDGKEWIVYRMLRPPFENSLEFERAEDWESWLRDNPDEPHEKMYELVATGLTYTQARSMVQMSE